MKDFIRISCASPELKVADIEFNLKEILNILQICKNEKTEIVLFPELSITSYSCGDLFYQENLLLKSIDSLIQISQFTQEINISCIIGLPLIVKNKIYNSAAFISNGKILGIVPKTFLPNSQEFYEDRWFSSEFDRNTNSVYIDGNEIPFGADLIFYDTQNDFRFGIEICEDLWVIEPPSNRLCIEGANIIFNPSASPENIGKYQYRKDIVRIQSAKTMSAYIYSSSGINESTTDVVYSGHSMIYENGILLSESKRFSFESEIIFADIDISKLRQEKIRNSSYKKSKSENQFREIKFYVEIRFKEKILQKINNTPFVVKDKLIRNEVIQEIVSIQSSGLAKRLKHTNTKKVILGLSGGLDSTLALLIAVESFQKLHLDLNGIICISMPGFGTTIRTKTNSESLAEELKISFQTISIIESVKQHFKDINQDENNFDITFENSQARERTQILMDLANKENALVIGTGDMSELALGWCTYNGDHMSMYALNSGIPKTLIQSMVQFFAEEKYKNRISDILNDISDTPISPELLPSTDGKISQITEDFVGPYILHDFFMYYMLRYYFSPTKIYYLAKQAFENEYSNEVIMKWMNVFYKRFFSQQFKRSCIPDGPKVGSISLSPRGDLRMPSDASVNLWLTEIQNLSI